MTIHNIDLSDYQATPDLSKAETLPSRWYTNPAFLELEKNNVFWKTWQWVGNAELVQRPGDFFSINLLGEPLVITRGSDDKLRAFFNVCQHRAGLVAQGKGNRKTLQCMYHGWTYNLDGKLRDAPDFDGVVAWEKEEVCLTPVQVEQWGPFIFVNLDPDAPSFTKIMKPIYKEIKERGFAFETMRSIERRDYEIQCNWKVYVDNYLEGYHIPVAHPGLYSEIEYDKYEVKTFEFYSSQIAPIKPASDVTKRGRDRRYIRIEEEGEALYYWIFPNWVLNIYPDNLSINIILPQGHNRTLTIFEWFYDAPGTGPGWESMQQAIAFSDDIQWEDIEICEAVQKGLQSRAYDKGRFSVKHENGVHHFHTLLHHHLSKST